MIDSAGMLIVYLVSGNKASKQIIQEEESESLGGSWVNYGKLTGMIIMLTWEELTLFVW